MVKRLSILFIFQLLTLAIFAQDKDIYRNTTIHGKLTVKDTANVKHLKINNTLIDTNKFVTNGNLHDHSGGDGAQIDHTTLSNIGTNTHAQIDVSLVTNGNSHDHSGGDGAQINHTTLSNIGTNTHATIDTRIEEYGPPHTKSINDNTATTIFTVETSSDDPGAYLITYAIYYQGDGLGHVVSGMVMVAYYNDGTLYSQIKENSDIECFAGTGTLTTTWGTTTTGTTLNIRLTADSSFNLPMNLIYQVRKVGNYGTITY